MTEPVKKVVEAGVGVGIVSAHAVTRELAAGHLMTAAIEGLTITRHLAMVTRPERYFTSIVIRDSLGGGAD